MKPDLIVDSEALSDVEGHTDVTHLIGASVVIDMQKEPQRSAFNAYRVAFRQNEHLPNRENAAALVHAWNVFADIMGVDRV